MIISIKHKGLIRLWSKNDASLLPADQVPKLMAILDLLDEASDVSDTAFHGADLHPLFRLSLKLFLCLKEECRLLTPAKF